MRNIGIIIILVILGLSLWNASDRYQPALSDTAVSTAKPERVEDETADKADYLSSSKSIEIGQPEEPDQIETTGQSVDNESSVLAVKPRQKRSSSVQADKSFDQVIIPSLKLNARVVPKPYSELSWDLTSLGHDVALLGDIPNQTSENNIVIAGHVTARNGSNGPFRYLWQLEPGDQILLKEGNYTYTYAVREQVLVYPDETSVLEDSQNPQLTLITCTTWDEETLSYLRRRVIVADLDSVELQQIRMD